LIDGARTIKSIPRLLTFTRHVQRYAVALVAQIATAGGGIVGIPEGMGY